MFTRFFKKNKPQPSGTPGQPSKAASSDLIAPQTAEQLLGTERRQILLDRIWEQTSVTKDSFQKLYREPIGRYAELVQEFPASETHHHSYLGGMLDHGLELVLYALRLRQSYLLPIGATPEDQAKYADIWTAGAAYGGLLHDTGKIISDIHVETEEGTWHPWHGALKKPYRFHYVKGRDYNLHNAAAGLLCLHILGAEVLDWLAKNPPLWSSLVYLLSGSYSEAGVLGEIVSKADRTSTALNIGANPEKALQAPPTSLQAHLLRGLRHLLKDEEQKLRLNMKGAAGWLTQDGLWLVSKVVADKLRSFLLSQGVDKVPSKNSSLFDELQSHRLIEPNASGQAIWKAKVIDGDWQQDFTFLRVQPSLIWGNEEYPPAFSGTVTPEATQTAQTAPVSDDSPRKPDTPTSTQTASQTPVASVSAPNTPLTAHTDNASHELQDDIDDVLSLFDNTAAPATPPTHAAKTGTAPALEPVVTDDSEDVIPFEPEAGQPLVASVASPPPATVSKSKPASQAAAPVASHGFNFHANMKPEELGQAFMSWLKDAINRKTLYINDSKAMIHIVDGKAFMITPAIFQRFSQQFPELDKINPEQGQPWRWVQKSFERLKLHEKMDNDLNIWKCSVRGPRKKANSVNGYMLQTQLLFDFQPTDNPFVAVLQEP